MKVEDKQSRKERGKTGQAWHQFYILYWQNCGWLGLEKGIFLYKSVSLHSNFQKRKNADWVSSSLLVSVTKVYHFSSFPGRIAIVWLIFFVVWSCRNWKGRRKGNVIAIFKSHQANEMPGNFNAIFSNGMKLFLLLTFKNESVMCKNKLINETQINLLPLLLQTRLSSITSHHRKCLGGSLPWHSFLKRNQLI